MTATEIADFERALNELDPYTVWKALHGLHEHALRGPETTIDVITGDATSDELGVTIRETAEELVCFRVSFPAPPGLDRMHGRRRQFMYDALFMTPKSFEGFRAALAATLRDRGSELGLK